MLFRSRLAYVEETRDGAVNLVLHNLAAGDEFVLAENVRAEYLGPIRIFVTNNTVTWSEPAVSDGISKIVAMDLPGNTTRILHDAVTGYLTGATDEHFITEEYVYRRDKRDRIVIRRYTADGREKELADFVATGLAGQSRVIGRYAAWVNPERKIVLEPLDGHGDKISFRPF